MLADARKTLEAVFEKLGLSPSALLLSQADERVLYKLRRGSADVIVALQSKEGRAFVRVVAPILVPPTAADRRAALHERLLELNAHGMQNAAFGLSDGRVIAVSERPAMGLDQAEFEQMLTHLSAVADTYDDKLVAEFGGQRASDA